MNTNTPDMTNGAELGPLARRIVWYHGTSTISGLDIGDYIDPDKGNFEPMVWATASRAHAQYFADSAAALGGDPVIYTIELRTDRVLTVDNIDDYDENDFAGWRDDDAIDAVIFMKGEDGEPALAICDALSAKVGA